MPNYIFLDNWVFSEYTKPEKQQQLSDFIEMNDYTILFPPIAATELYNPNWELYPDNDRTIHTARFLSQHRCQIIRPEELYAAEVQAFPDGLRDLPIAFSLDSPSMKNKFRDLISIFHREAWLVEQGIDIEKWANDYEILKKSWLSDAQNIIENACNSGVLIRNNGKFIELERCKERFLITLDNRHIFDPDGRPLIALRSQHEPLIYGETKRLLAVRFSSLCFWYAYIEQEKGFQTARKGSDIGDFSNMSFIPYCSAFTIDNTMSRVARRAISDVGYHCKLYTQAELDTILSQQ